MLAGWLAGLLLRAVFCFIDSDEIMGDAIIITCPWCFLRRPYHVLRALLIRSSVHGIVLRTNLEQYNSALMNGRELSPLVVVWYVDQQ